MQGFQYVLCGCCLISAICCCNSTALQAQIPDNEPTIQLDLDSVLSVLEDKPARKKFFSGDYPDPKKAAFLSLVVPGAGQVYNKRYWKVPLVYGAMGSMVALIDFNQSRYRRFRTALDLKRKDLPHEFSGTRLDNANSLRIIRDQYDKNMQLSYVGLVLAHALQAMEAFVDAHLRSFDVGEDLSLQVKPMLQPDLLGRTPAPSVGIVLRFE